MHMLRITTIRMRSVCPTPRAAAGAHRRFVMSRPHATHTLALPPPATAGSGDVPLDRARAVLAAPSAARGAGPVGWALVAGVSLALLGLALLLGEPLRLVLAALGLGGLALFRLRAWSAGWGVRGRRRAALRSRRMPPGVPRPAAHTGVRPVVGTGVRPVVGTGVRTAVRPAVRPAA